MGVGSKAENDNAETSSAHPPGLGGLSVLQYLLGGGGNVSGADGHAARGFDEFLTLLSVGLHLEMDSNMQHEDGSQKQQRDWTTQTDHDQSKPQTQETVLEDLTAHFHLNTTFFNVFIKLDLSKNVF